MFKAQTACVVRLGVGAWPLGFQASVRAMGRQQASRRLRFESSKVLVDRGQTGESQRVCVQGDSASFCTKGSDGRTLMPGLGPGYRMSSRRGAGGEVGITT